MQYFQTSMKSMQHLLKYINNNNNNNNKYVGK